MDRERRPRRPWPLLTSFLGIVVLGTLELLTAQTPPRQEISSHDVEPPFKLQAERNLVMVRVVVRDAKGAIIENLRKEDFQLFDRGKPQTILHFSLEKPALKSPEGTGPKSAEKAAAPEVEEETAIPASTASRFVALFFDDVNTSYPDLARTRDAADHFLTTSKQPGDRIALFTSSGQKQVDFTDDLEKIHQALFDLRPRSIVGELGKSCGTLQPYVAYLIAEQHDPNALQVAAAQILNCNPCPANIPQAQHQCEAQAESTAEEQAMSTLQMSETQSLAALRGIESVVRLMTFLPGQRSVVIISGGFLTDTLLFQIDQITERALRGGVIVNALDARGLYTDPSIPDASQDSKLNIMVGALQGRMSFYLKESARQQTDGMQALALDTGGIFFNNNNDLEAGLHKAAGRPESYYVLAFSPQGLKTDGSFHPLQVKLVTGKDLTVQARKGYYAPKKPNDPAAQEKDDIRDAVFSQEETHELPIDVHTQFFMKSESEARITVLTRLDLRTLHLRKEADRNIGKLVFVTAIFDQNGRMIDGQQKSLELYLLDASLQRLLQTGITSQSSFDIKPGTYLVRAIVRDSESGQISGLNRTVEIPF